MNVKRLFQKSFALSILFFALLAMFPANTFASAKTSVGSTAINPNSNNACMHLSVHLNGSALATITCLDNQINSKKINPHTGLGDCNNDDVTIWWDPSFSGPSMCFSGSGFVNLTNYAAPLNEVVPCHCTTWNDQASSFALDGCALSGTSSPSNASYPGYFASDSNGGGTLQYFKWNVSKSWSDFNGQNGILPENSLSSIYIDC